MQIEDRLLDIIRRPAVVVDDRDAGNGLEQRAALDLLRPVGVDDDEQAPVVRLDQRILSGDEQILAAGRGLELGDQALAGVFLQVDHDPGRALLHPAQAQKTHGRAECVQIRHPVSHDIDRARLPDELGQRTRHHAGFDARMPLRFLGAAAVEGEVEPVLDDGLVAAAGKGHLDGEGREAVILREAPAVLADAERDRRGHAAGGRDVAHVLQDAEPAVLQAGKILALEDQQIPVAFDLAAQRLQSRRPVGHDVVELRVERGDGRVGEVGSQLVVVIDQDDRDDRPRAEEFVADVEHLGHVGKIDGRQLHSRRVVFGFDVVAVDAVAAAADDLVARQLGAALAQPAGGEAGHDRVERLIARSIGKAGDGKEAGVAPDDLIFRQPDDRHRERGARVDRNADGIRRRLHVAHQLPLAPGKPCAADDKHDERDEQRAARKDILPDRGGRGGKQQHGRKVPARIRIKQTSDRLFHRPPPPVFV